MVEAELTNSDFDHFIKSNPLYLNRVFNHSLNKITTLTSLFKNIEDYCFNQIPGNRAISSYVDKQSCYFNILYENLLKNSKLHLTIFQNKNKDSRELFGELLEPYKKYGKMELLLDNEKLVNESLINEILPDNLKQLRNDLKHSSDKKCKLNELFVAKSSSPNFGYRFHFGIEYILNDNTELVVFTTCDFNKR